MFCEFVLAAVAYYLLWASLRAPAPRRVRVIVTVEGEIGAGKTELVRALAAELETRGVRVCTVLEPVDQWSAAGILEKFYADPARYAYSFQSYVYVTRTVALARAFAEHAEADVFLLERSPATDNVFVALLRETMDPVELRMYETWCGAWQDALGVDLSSATVLYLKPSLETCMGRVAKRGRRGEVTAGAADTAPAGVSQEYQARLRRAHEAFFEGEHAGEFPHLRECPYAATVVAGPELADKNFRDPGPERDWVLAALIERLGISARKA
jgi:deoxyadenosine/deoxycytidine kinase